MSKLLEAFAKNQLTLIVALPENSEEFVNAAIDGGADALMVRISGPIEKEKRSLLEVMASSDVPVGIFLSDKIKGPDIKRIKAMGFDFFVMPLEDIPAGILKTKGISKVADIDPSYSVDKLIGIPKLGIDAIEASIIPKNQCGKNLTVGDLQKYITVCISANVPVIIPTECAIKVSEIAIIWDTGAKAIVINDTITGKTIKSLKKAVNEFRIAVDDIGV
ncbi:MAG: hypothetical protein NT030_04955 [Candidatus Saganbacteria bacterium]|nr:hypothetical protein [Candidatus Saganbacteria bacterium]